MVGEVHDEAVETVRDRRTGRAAGGVVGPEHEMVEEELRAPSEEIREGRCALVGLEAVLLVDPDPGQLLPPPRQLVAAPCVLLFRLEQLVPRCQPLVTCPDRVCRHGPSLPSSGVIRRSFRSRCDVPVSGHDINLVRGIERVGVTSVAGFRWTR